MKREVELLHREGMISDEDRHDLLGDDTSVCPPHDWEAGGMWGVIVGVSRCRRCERVSRSSDFHTHETGRDEEHT